MATLQHLPYLGTAEPDVLFVEWLVAEGATVGIGTPLATVETLKAAFEVEAECAGVVLRRLCEPGQRVPVQAPIAVVGQAGEPHDAAVVRRLAKPMPGAAPAAATVPGAATPTPGAPNDAPGSRPVAPAARVRASELGIDVTTVAGTGADGLVRVVDVERAHRDASTRSSVPTGATGSRGVVDAAFLALVRKDQQAFAALGSELKLSLYRRHGADIGEGCVLGAGAVLLVDRLVLGERAFVGPATSVEARQLEAGPLLHFGARCRVRCTRASFGENAFFADDVEIGGGGALDPEAELIVGGHGFVGEHVHLNPCRRLQIGDEVVVSRGAVVMTHSFGPSWLRGYPSRFAGVSIGDGAQLGIAATLFPGVDVGAGAVILSGSSVVTAVPAGRLFGGVPAVDLKAAAQQLSVAELERRAGELVVEFARQLRLRGHEVAIDTEGDRSRVSVVRDGRTHRLEFASRVGAGSAAAGLDQGVAEHVRVAVWFDDAAFAATTTGVTAIGLEPPRVRGPLGPLAAAFREFLRKRGVRLHPRGWAYVGGWL